MQIYFAPMEGITDSIYRRIHHRYFPGIDRYYMPFLSPTMHRCLTHKEDRELPLADSVDFTAIPQVLTKNAGDFLWAAEQCRDRGYDEVNLNLGCPSGTVVAKGKGSGMLADTEALDRFLDEVCTKSPIPVSIKTRVGLHSHEEFPKLLSVFNQYPIRELTIHPRVRTDFYMPPLRMDAFDYALENTKIPICYNGDITSTADLERFAKQYPQVKAVMIGRGLIGDPGMFCPNGNDPMVLKQFHDDLLEEYTQCFGSARNAMFRMKENWHYLQSSFQGGEKLFKQLRKTTDLQEFQGITNEIFHTLPLGKQVIPL